MEHKIGEIFEYNGEWYQCVDKGFNCDDCDIKGDCSSTYISACSSRLRKDGKQVRFKKLKKIGEPYEYSVQHRGIVMLQPYKLFTTPIINGVVCNVNYDTYTIDLEIKQNKEDMKEKKIQHYDCFFDRKPTLKEFDLEAAKAGKPVCTRDGRKARIICKDLKANKYPIVAAVLGADGVEFPHTYTLDGIYSEGEESGFDLMILPEKKEGWVNLYRGFNGIYAKNVFDTKQEALEYISDCETCIATIKIEWY